MKRVQKKKKNIKRVLGFTALTLALVCVFVVGFFAIKTGSIFGFSYGTTYVDKDATPENIPDERLKVTGQEDYSSVLSPTSSEKYSGNNSMPEIPEANSSFDKGTKENPLVILEIVPELSQQSLSYFASSKEEGLPFDPLEMSMKLSKKFSESYVKASDDPCTLIDSEGKNYQVKSQTGLYKGGNLKDSAGWLGGKVGGFFSGNNDDASYQIYDYDFSVLGSSRKTNGHDYDFSNAPLVVVDSYFTVEMKKGFSFVKGLSKDENGGSQPTIASLYDGNADFKAAFVDKDNQDIPREVIEDEKNWAWSVVEDSDTNKNFTISISSPTADFESDFAEMKTGALGKNVFIERYKDILSRADDGTAVTSDEFARTEAWTFNDAQEKYKGYFVKVGSGNGNVEIPDVWNINPKDGGSWKYVVDASQLSAEGTNLWPEGYQHWQVNNSVVAAKEGDYFPVSSLGAINNSSLASMLESAKTYTINYNYKGYKLTFQYMGIKWNDVLKRMLVNFTDELDSEGNVIKTADEQYNDYHIKIISVTPDMINEMNKKDTEDTLDYIERADMFYVSSYNKGIDQISKMRLFYWDFIDPDKETALKTNKSDTSQFASFEENDLEWSICMKIIKRLSGDAGLPMMYSKQMGDYLDKGTDNVCNLLYDSTYKHNKKGSLCNLAKLYLITTLFDLSATTTSETSNDLIWTFMDNVYANIQQVKLSDSAKSPDNTAQYTGYFKEVEEGVNAVCTSDDTKSMYTYLWNLYTFVPYVTSASEDSLYSSDGSPDLKTFVNKYGFLSSSLLGTYPEKTYGYIDPGKNNVNNSGYDYGLKGSKDDESLSFFYTRLTGTRDPLNDYQNVTIVMPGDQKIVTWQMGQNNEGVPGTFLKGSKGNYDGSENSANPNFSIIDKGVMSRIAVVLFNIMKNAKAPNPTMKFNIDANQQSKKYYQKMSNSNVLIDYNQAASYNEQRSKEKNVLKLFCTLNNSTNRENSIITSIKLVDPNDSSKPAIPIDTIYNTDGDVIEKEENIGFSETLPTPKKYSVEFITGYKVTSNNAKYSFVVPFKLSDWQNGYTQMRIDWVARSSKKVKGKFTPYQNPSNPNDKDLVESARQFAEIDIGERELFDLE